MYLFIYHFFLAKWIGRGRFWPDKVLMFRPTFISSLLSVQPLRLFLVLHHGLL